MVRFKIGYSAYDNVWKGPMGISLSVGISCTLSGFFGGLGKIIGWIGIISLVLFVFFKILNIITAVNEKKELKRQMMELEKEKCKIINQMINDYLSTKEENSDFK